VRRGQFFDFVDMDFLRHSDTLCFGLGKASINVAPTIAKPIIQMPQCHGSNN
jgi:hypothetical protein